jgi:hypothetical protein
MEVLYLRLGSRSPLQFGNCFRNIAFIFILAQDAVVAEIDDLLGRKVKAKGHRQETAKKEGQITMYGRSSHMHTQQQNANR